MILNNFSYQKANLHIGKLESLLGNWTHFKEDHSHIRFNIFTVQFLNGDYKEAQESLNLLLTLPKSAPRKDLREAALLFEPLLFFCRNNLELVGYRLRATERYFRRTGNAPAWAAQLFEFLREVSRQSLKSNDKEALKRFGSALQLVNRDREKIGFQLLCRWLRQVGGFEMNDQSDSFKNL